ncbi:hypothetical protein GEMRC1_006827 [Eukaryota sp. GEM-RC1]
MSKRHLSSRSHFDAEDPSSVGFPKKSRRSKLDSWELKQLKAAGVKTSSLIDPSALKEEDEEEALPDISACYNPNLLVKEVTDPRLAHSCYSDSHFSITSLPEGSLTRAAVSAKSLIRSIKPPHASMSSSRHTSRTRAPPPPSTSTSLLPIADYKEQILSLILSNPFSVILGETGSGKTTQIPQFLAYHSALNQSKMIGITQPRRVAAMSVAQRVADELNSRLGDIVGYNIRFESVQSEYTKILYMTDGVLLKELQSDHLLSKYSVIMLDEAHERSVNSDLLIGLLRKVVEKRSDLRVVVTSATLDSQKFVDFLDCPSLSIPGRQFPVDVFYTKTFDPDYISNCVETVKVIHTDLAKSIPGDVLVFLTGAEEIELAVSMMISFQQSLTSSEYLNLDVFGLYSSMASEEQKKVFLPASPGSRKVIFSTNIAETSITIDGIVYVVDSGFMKIKSYNPKLSMDQLVIVPISKANARQRSGRAGRTQPGKCFRLYTRRGFEQEMIENPIPELLRSNLMSVVLMMKSLGVIDLKKFKFLDPPSMSSISAAENALCLLGATTEDGFLTPLGRRLSQFPLDPCLAKMLLSAVDLNCSRDAVIVSAMLSVEDVFNRPSSRQKPQSFAVDDIMGSSSGSSSLLARAESAHSRFIHGSGDHKTLLNVYQKWEVSGFTYEWCKRNFIHFRAMKEAREIVKQLSEIMTNLRLPLTSCNSSSALIQSIGAGHFFKVAKRDGEGYKTLAEGTSVFIHPSSTLFYKQPRFVVYNELVLTTREYMRCVSIIDPRWLVKICPKMFQYK